MTKERNKELGKKCKEEKRNRNRDRNRRRIRIEKYEELKEKKAEIMSSPYL